ncbi:hypothetical protein P154DRAFT_526171 [Amniculicola lignicola CBS 123094]|uniref:Uncharacterized protein n=1 Tax=Amniculicola lignicola CBS 123094 TaxID=1392246 RepID=A0A6A5W1L9_9PLEO|nr:hypothetical protein P154DRAFT_526171 [Amniculicola lignicola CBS 123094]
MAVPSDVIAKNPIGKGLDEFRHALKATCNEMGIHDSPSLREKVTHLEAPSGVRDLIVRLIFSLQSLPAAESLYSRIS